MSYIAYWAYFILISDLLKKTSKLIKKQENIIYFIGDSHILSLAWTSNTIFFKSRIKGIERANNPSLKILCRFFNVWIAVL